MRHWPELSDAVCQNQLSMMPADVYQDLHKLDDRLTHLDACLSWSSHKMRERMLSGSKCLAYQDAYRFFKMRRALLDAREDWLMMLSEEDQLRYKDHLNLWAFYFAHAAYFLLSDIAPRLHKIQQTLDGLFKRLRPTDAHQVLPEEMRDPVYRYLTVCQASAKQHQLFLSDRLLDEVLVPSRWHRLYHACCQSSPEGQQNALVVSQGKMPDVFQEKHHFTHWSSWLFQGQDTLKETASLALQQIMSSAAYPGVRIAFDAEGKLFCRFSFLNAKDYPKKKTAWPLLFRGTYTRYRLTRDVFAYGRIAILFEHARALLSQADLDPQPQRFSDLKAALDHQEMEKKDVKKHLWPFFHARALAVVDLFLSHVAQLKSQYAYWQIQLFQKRIRASDGLQKDPANNLPHALGLWAEWYTFECWHQQDRVKDGFDRGCDLRKQYLSYVMQCLLRGLDALLCNASGEALGFWEEGLSAWQVHRSFLLRQVTQHAESDPLLVYRLFDCIFKLWSSDSEVPFDQADCLASIRPCIAFWPWSMGRSERMRFLRIRHIQEHGLDADDDALFLMHCIIERHQAYSVLPLGAASSVDQVVLHQDYAPSLWAGGAAQMVVPEARHSFGLPFEGDEVVKQLAMKIVPNGEVFMNPMVYRAWQTQLGSWMQTSFYEDVQRTDQLLKGLNNQHMVSFFLFVWADIDLDDISASAYRWIRSASARLGGIRQVLFNDCFACLSAWLRSAEDVYLETDPKKAAICAVRLLLRLHQDALHRGHKTFVRDCHEVLLSCCHLICSADLWLPVLQDYVEHQGGALALRYRRTWFLRALVDRSFAEQHQHAYIAHSDYPFMPLFLGMHDADWSKVAFFLSEVTGESLYLSTTTLDWLALLGRYAKDKTLARFSESDETFKRWRVRALAQDALSSAWEQFQASMQLNHFGEAYKAFDEGVSRVRDLGLISCITFNRWFECIESKFFYLLRSYLYVKRHRDLSSLHEQLIAPIKLWRDLDCSWRFWRWDFLCHRVSELMPVVRGLLSSSCLQALDAGSLPLMKASHVLFFHSGLVSAKFYERFIKAVDRHHAPPLWARALQDLCMRSPVDLRSAQQMHAIYDCLDQSAFVVLVVEDALHESDPIWSYVRACMPHMDLDALTSLLRVEKTPIDRALDAYRTWTSVSWRAQIALKQCDVYCEFVSHWFERIKEASWCRFMSRPFRRMCLALNEMYRFKLKARNKDDDVRTIWQHGDGIMGVFYWLYKQHDMQDFVARLSADCARDPALFSPSFTEIDQHAAGAGSSSVRLLS